MYNCIYGSSSYNIENLSSLSDGDYVKFIDFVNTIEMCYLDLKRLNCCNEMNTSCMISKIERLLPAVQKRDWVLSKQKLPIGSHDNFEKFLDFLIQEKSAMEYMMADIRQKSKTSYKVNTVSLDEQCTNSGTYVNLTRL